MSDCSACLLELERTSAPSASSMRTNVGGCYVATRLAAWLRKRYPVCLYSTPAAMKERISPRHLRALPPLRSERLLDQVRERLRYMHYSLRTEEAYVYWVRGFVRWSGMRHPRELGAAEVAGLSDHARQRAAGRGGHASPGAERAALSLPRGARHRHAVAAASSAGRSRRSASRSC